MGSRSTFSARLTSAASRSVPPFLMTHETPTSFGSFRPAASFIKARNRRPPATTR